MDNTCVCCGVIIPEGQQVCPNCKSGMTLKTAIQMLEFEYERAKKLEFIHNPLAWALYQVWKKADVMKGGE